MIRGAFILAVGFTLGYAKALQENEAITDLAKTLKEDFKSFVDEKAPTENTETPDKPEEEETVDER